MSKFPECFAETCHQTASVYVEKEKSYFCGDCLDPDFDENEVEKLVSPDDVAMNLEIVEDVLKKFKDFAADKYEDETNEATKNLCDELLCDVEGLKDKLTKALNGGLYYEFSTLNTKATNIKRTLESKKTFACFAFKKLWRSAQKEKMSIESPASEARQPSGEEDKLQEELKQKELRIETLEKENKKLHQEKGVLKAESKDQDHSQSEPNAEDQQESSALKASASGDTSALEKTKMEKDKNPEITEEEKASVEEEKKTEQDSEEVDLVYKEETYSNGDSYKGQVNTYTEKQHGQGTYLWKSGKKYIGQWKNGKPEGQGIMYFESGDMYEGEWVNGKKHGTGLFTWKNGATYQGEWANDWRNGQGIYKKQDGSFYEGEWEDDKKSGQGVECHPSGNKYVGQYQNGLWHGEGVFTFKDGSTYQGHWENNEENGYGVLIDPNTGEIYEGQWKDGEEHGEFTVILKDGQRVTQYYDNDK
ncbi:unnamed protein product [Moneuplotes crassus]|uniref:MORN repeat protein n=1 Tax=Euplotes crassus TaxID=5936 RepID=A0AAD1Y1J3_EUPCR|nr:unnamed protein product [Moneuplotes crassus]